MRVTDEGDLGKFRNMQNFPVETVLLSILVNDAPTRTLPSS